MVKDRLSELQIRHNDYLNEDDDIDAGPSFADPPTERDPLFDVEANWSDIETFLRPVNEVQNQIDSLKSLLSQIKAIHHEILISPGVHPDVTKRWGEMIEDFTETSKSVNLRIKELTDIANKLEESPVHNRIKQNHIMILTRASRSILYQFAVERDRYRQQSKDRMRNYYRIANVEFTEEEIDDAIDNGNVYSTKSLMMGERQRRILFDDVNNRHEQLVKLENSIKELHEMFQDLHMLVESQGDVLNNIETNIQNAANYAKNAQRNVVQARAAKDRNIKCKIAACIAIALAVLTFIVFVTGAFCFYLPFVCR